MPVDSIEIPGWSAALTEAFYWHAGQTRKHSGLPYATHCVEVSHLLERLGFERDVLIAALLHDALEDTAMPPERVETLFGPEVLCLVQDMTEIKNDAQGKRRPWIDRKRDHICHLKSASLSARAISLADQWHNLQSVLTDWLPGDERFWEAFRASPADFLEYHSRKRLACDQGEARIKILSVNTLELINRIGSRLKNELPGIVPVFTEADWSC